MLETWIRPNRRALALGFVVPGLLLATAVGTWMLASNFDGNVWLRTLSVALVIAAAILAATLWRMMQQPRVAYDPRGDVLVYFGLAQPERVPVETVECFFLGQAGGMIPDAAGKEAEVRTVILRLAESAVEYHHRDVKAALGHWCEGYITIRGTWCEHITPELMKQLNQRLVQLQRERKAEATA